MNIVAIVQARTGSSRLPNKIFLELEGKVVLDHVVERLKRSTLISKVVIATTINQNDDAIEEFCNKRNLDFYRGSEEDVLSRYYETACLFNGDIIVRITSDCPLIDPELVDLTIQMLIDNEADLAANVGIDPINRTFPRGLDVEVFTFDAIAEAYEKGVLIYEREHVTPYLYRNSNKIKYVKNDLDYSKYRWTLDTYEDYELIKLIYKNVYLRNEFFGWKEVLEFMENNSDYYFINSEIEQKKLV